MTRADHDDGGRLLFIDAARGVAMLFVFLSHFGYVYFGASGGHTREVIAAVGMIASPTFVLISGFLLGFLYRTRQKSFDRLRSKLIDRGIFLLTVGHGVILLAHLPLQASWRWGFVTDAIGLSMIAGALLIDRTSPVQRLVISASIYGAALILGTAWHPTAPWLQFLDETLFGSMTPTIYIYNFPVLPWFSLYFAGSVIGERVAGMRLVEDASETRRTLLLPSWSAACLALIAIEVLLLLPQSQRHLRHEPSAVNESKFAVYVENGYRAAEMMANPTEIPLPARLLSPFQKLSPGPVYFGLYGSIGLLILYSCFILERRGVCQTGLRWIAVLGRASLFAFVAQYFVYYTFLELLAPRVTAWWPLVFALSVLALGSAAAVWHATGANRFITVGYPRLEALAARWRTTDSRCDEPLPAKADIVGRY